MLNNVIDFDWILKKIEGMNQKVFFSLEWPNIKTTESRVDSDINSFLYRSFKCLTSGLFYGNFIENLNFL